MKLAPEQDVIVLDILRLEAMLTALVDTMNSTPQSTVCETFTQRGSLGKHLTKTYANGTVEVNESGFDKNIFKRNVKSAWKKGRNPGEIGRPHRLYFPMSCN